MFRRASAATFQVPQTRSFVQRQSEQRVEAFADKIVRDASPTDHYVHPSYVMAREKMLSTIWRDNGLFKNSIYVMAPFFTVVGYYKC